MTVGCPENIGKRVVIPEQVRPTYESWDYLRHYDGPQARQGLADSQTTARAADQGTHCTRFHRGFQRRRAVDIQSKDAAEVLNNERKLDRSHKASTFRQQRLADLDNMNGYDPITGMTRQRFSELPKRAARSMASSGGHQTSKPEADPRASEMSHVGKILLRDSHYRFFAPQTTGNNLIRRQQFSHYAEGIRKPKQSSILGVGRNDLPSAGVSDMFQFADYGDSTYYSAPGPAVVAKRRHEAKLAEIESVRQLK